MNKLWQNDYVESMEQIKFTEKQRERMVDFMVNHTEKKQNHVPALMAGISSGIRRLAIAGTCLCIITAGAAGAHAAGVFKPVSEAFREVFHLDADTAQITDDIGNTPDKSDTSNHVSITADAILGDDYNFAVVFSIRKEDGTSFRETDMQALTAEQNNVNFRSMDITIDKKTGNQRGYYHFYNAGPDDPSFQLLYTCATDSLDSMGAQVTASFTDFGYYDSSRNFVPVASGDWNITFPLDYADSTRHLAASQQIKQGTKTITIKKADVSPIGFHIELETKSGKNIEEMKRIMKNFPLELILTDGKKINLKKKSRGFSVWAENNSTYAAYGNTFQQIIPIEQMKSLRIGNLDLDF